jgi:hypothetical protein
MYNGIDHKAVGEVACPYCRAIRGVPCKIKDKWSVRRQIRAWQGTAEPKRTYVGTHASRIKAYEPIKAKQERRKMLLQWMNT